MSSIDWLAQAEVERAIQAHEPLLPGWHLFPVQDKRPVTGLRWTTAASADPVERAAMAELAHDGWAVACGPSGLLVVDIDVHDADGYSSWCGLLAEQRVPANESNPRVIGATPSGGRHLYYSNEAGIGNRVGIVPGVDIRGVGGYAVLSGSKRRLTILDWAYPPAPKPLLDLLKQAVESTVPKITLGSRRGAGAALRSAVNLVAHAAPGRRNDLLNWAAFVPGREAVVRGASPETVEALLLDAAAECGLPLAEARATIRSGLGVRV